MGLLSRKKAAPAQQPAAAPPAISAPISITATPAVSAIDHGKVAAPSQVAGLGVTAMAPSGESILPSPPRSPVAASCALCPELKVLAARTEVDH